MGQRECEIVERSLERLAERAGDPTAEVFARLFAAHPETEGEFARDVTGAVRAEMLTMVFTCLMDPAGPYQAALVRTERVNHDGFGVPPQLFDRFFQIVKATCRDLLKDDWTPEVEAAWTAQIDRVLATSA
ncbi:MAG: globin domain-containing protein [Pseudomonadota bacterium]